MNIYETAAELRKKLAGIRGKGASIALVPTMGNLHAGHLALVESARQNADYTVCTIFINPMQFGPDEDLERYPRTLQQDTEQLQQAGCDGIFIPAVDEMYPTGLHNQTVISVPKVSDILCGKSRPGHFDGVCTVVMKLFNLVQPDMAFFGYKDYQQLFIIRRMAQDLCVPIDIRGIPIQREDTGLALSSRNMYLSKEQKELAPGLYQVLQSCAHFLQEKPANDFDKLSENARQSLTLKGFKVDYLEIRNATSLAPVEPGDKDLVILAAAFLGDTRLIDNVRVAVSSDTAKPVTALLN